MQSHAAVSLRCSIAIAALVPALLSAQNSTPSTPESQRTASPSELRVFDPSLLDASVDPCENFYRFSCNGWFKRNPLPPDQTSYGRFTELFELNRLHLKQILEGASSKADSRSPNEQKIGDEYASCMDTATINKQGLKPLQQELDRIAAVKSVSDLPSELAHLHAIGVDAFFGMGSNQDFADASQVISFYRASGLGLPERDYYTRSDAKSVEQRQQYVDHVRKMLALAGEPDAEAAKDAEIVLAIEPRLAKASLPVPEQRDPQNLTHPTDIPKFEKELPHFKLAEYVAEIHAPASGRMNDTEPK